MIVIKGYNILRYIQWQMLGILLVEKRRTCHEVQLV